MDIYQLKIVLQDIRPSIRRRLHVPATITLDQLHETIQLTMGWSNSHLHLFSINNIRYGGGGVDAPSTERDESGVLLGDLVRKDSRFSYRYDFGDDWVHEIIFEKCLSAEPGMRYPRCLDGKRACPPEDCGGAYGYEDLLETLADPECPEHEDVLEWLGGKFDPEYFDLEQTNKALEGLSFFK